MDKKVIEVKLLVDARNKLCAFAGKKGYKSLDPFIAEQLIGNGLPCLLPEESYKGHPEYYDNIYGKGNILTDHRIPQSGAGSLAVKKKYAKTYIISIEEVNSSVKGLDLINSVINDFEIKSIDEKIEYLMKKGLEVFDNYKNLFKWLNSDNIALELKSPSEFMNSSEDINKVLNLINNIENGDFS